MEQWGVISQSRDPVDRFSRLVRIGQTDPTTFPGASDLLGTYSTFPTSIKLLVFLITKSLYLPNCKLVVLSELLKTSYQGYLQNPLGSLITVYKSFKSFSEKFQ